MKLDTFLDTVAASFPSFILVEKDEEACKATIRCFSHEMHVLVYVSPATSTFTLKVLEGPGFTVTGRNIPAAIEDVLEYMHEQSK